MGYKKISFLRMSIFSIGFIVLIMCAFWLPIVARKAAVMNPEYAYLRFPVLFALYITAIPFFIALYQSLKLLNSIKKDNAFSKLAVNSLGNIKNCALIIIVLYVLGMLTLAMLNALQPGLAVMGTVIVFATLVITLFAMLLQQLLKNAISLKSENELTV